MALGLGVLISIPSVQITLKLAMYEAGAQLVSLNTQSDDIYNLLMVGNFMDNGGKHGGYLLKP